jgi:protein ImuA
MLALASLLLAKTGTTAPILWIGTAEIFWEAGFPYAGGLQAMFGIEPEGLLFCEAKKLTDALWIAEEAARLTLPAAVILEVRGNPQQLDLTATRRLHARAREVDRPLFLLRQAAMPEPTAAPARLIFTPASTALRETIAGPLSSSIGRPAFTVAIGKGSSALAGQFTLEWNPDERIFEERWGPQKRAKDIVPVVSLSRHGTDPAAAPGTVLAFRQSIEPPVGGSHTAESSTTRDQPYRPERAAYRRPRRTG